MWGNTMQHDSVAFAIRQDATVEYMDYKGNKCNNMWTLDAGNSDGSNNNDYDMNFYDTASQDKEGTNVSSGIPDWHSTTFIPSGAGNLEMTVGGFTKLDIDGNIRSLTADYFGAYTL